jgi:hypothetical protein
MPSSVVPVLPHQARRRALAERLAVAGSDARAAEGRARVAGVRAEQLRSSREVLVNGDEGRQRAATPDEGEALRQR